MKRFHVPILRALMVALIVATIAAPVFAQQIPVKDVNGVDLVTPTEIEAARKLEIAIEDCAARVRPAVVGLVVGQAGGSGTIISADGYIITAGHVSVAPDQKCMVFMADGTTYEGKTLGLNRPADYGLIKFDPEKPVPFVRMGNSDKVGVGQWIVSMGHPLGTERVPFRPPVVRTGRVTSNRPGQISSDAPLISGDSGGPMFNLAGEIIGINVSIAAQSPEINNTTPINLPVQNMERMKHGESFNDRAGPDAQGDAGYSRLITGAYRLLDQKKYAESEAAFQKCIESDVENPDGYYHLACCYIRWALVSEGDEKDAYFEKAFANLRHAVSHGWQNLDHMSQDTDMDAIRDTAQYRNVLNRIARELGQSPLAGFTAQETADNSGVTISGLTDGGPAAAAGLQVGDVVKQLGNDTITSLDSLRAAVKKHKPADVTEFVVTRDGAEMHIEFEFGGSGGSGGAAVEAERGIKRDEKFRTAFKPVTDAVREATVAIMGVDARNRPSRIGYAVAIAENLVLCKDSDLGENPATLNIVLADGTKTTGRRVARDEDLDIAVLRLAEAKLTPVTFADSNVVDNTKIGAWLASVGTDDAPLSLGIRSLDVYEAPRVPFLGVSLEEVPDAVRQRVGISGGARITQVVPDTGAAQAGVQAQDIVWKVGKDEVKDVQDLIRLVRSRRVGETITFSIVRGAEKIELKATLGVRPPEGGDQRSNALKGPSSARSTAFGEVIQHDGWVKPNECGSAIVDSHGRVIGLNIARSDRTKTYALPADVLRKEIPKLIQLAMHQLDQEEEF